MSPHPPLPERILITGAAGFIGSNLIREILRRNPDAAVTAADDLSTGTAERLAGTGIETTRFDLETDDPETTWPGGPFDLIFHLGAITDTTYADDARMMRVNADGSQRLFDYAGRHAIPVLYASSAAVYGITDAPCVEGTSPIRPANAYGESKAETERRATAAVGLPRIVGLRYFNVYGPGEGHKGTSASMIHRLAAQMRDGRPPRIFEWGEQKRDFVHVADVVDATIRAARAPRDAVYNVGCGEARSFNEVIAALNAALGTDLEPEYFPCPYDFYQPFTQADLTRTREELGYTPRYRIEEGIAASVESRQTSSDSAT